MSGAKGPPPELPGFTFDRGIGGGGFADVFLFTQHSTGRSVAVKVLRLEHLSDTSLQQFQVEANVMAGVSAHPYIVTIHDAGVAPDGRPYIVMEHYPQPHFGIRARGGRLGLAEVLKVGVQIASAVETAHRAKIIHRDIKPANVLTSAFGDPGLTDFGIAGVQAEEGALSAAGGVSLGFAAPEVVLDELATGSVQSDVYSLAASIYALLSGRSPIWIPGGDNSAAAITQRVSNGLIQPLGRDDVPRSFQYLLEAALASSPQHRPASAVALAQALQDIEQELRLPATSLVLLGTAPTAPLSYSDDDEEGTRRKPQIVRVEGPPSATAPSDFRPATATPSESGVEPALGSWSPTSPATEPRGDRVGAEAELDTVAREGTADLKQTSPTTTPSTETPANGNRRLLMIGAVTLLVFIVAAVIVAANSGDKGNNKSTDGTTITQAAPQDPTGGIAFVSAPTDVHAILESDGRITVTWTPPTEIDNVEAVRYRAQILDPDFDDTIWIDDIETEELVITPSELGKFRGDAVCVEVYALIDDVISDPPSPTACTNHE